MSLFLKAVTAGIGFALGKGAAENPKVKKAVKTVADGVGQFSREMRDDLLSGLEAAGKEVSEFARELRADFVEKPKPPASGGEGASAGSSGSALA